jgi:hypothetical protein
MKTLKFFISLFIFCIIDSVNAQQTLAFEIDNYGPTLIIGSSLPSSFDYMHSKNHPFSKSTYRFVNVNYDANILNNTDVTDDNNIYNNSIVSTKPKYKYIDVAINHALAGGWRHIIILEGVYQANGSIIIDNIRNTPNAKAIGKITIEGEGYATSIVNASTFTNGPIFSVRSYYNTIKNMSIISDSYNTGEIGRNACIELLANQSNKKVKNNVFENLYLGAGGTSYVSNTAPPSSTEANLDSTNRRIGIKINAATTQVEFNKFKNITFNVLDTGIVLEGVTGVRVNDNIFENLNFDNIVVGVDFKAGVHAWENVFSNLALQTDTYTKHLVRNVNGTNNIFKNLYNSDWNAAAGGNVGQPNIALITLSAGSSHTTIKDSEININSLQFFQDSGSFTQISNCFNSGGGGVLDYKLGSTQGTSKINLLGRVIVGETSNSINSIAADYRLIVNGKVRVKEEVYVLHGGLVWPDYVFAKDYKLMPLHEVEQHIKTNGHLPNMPSAAIIEKDGIPMGDIIIRQQEKIEELTLHLIEIKKEIEALKVNQKN